MSKKALIIDDDEMTIMSLKNLLKQGGYEFEIAENGNDGVEKVKASSFDLVFIDFNLPDMGGDAVLSKIKESGSNYGKSVLMSGDENLNAEFENKGFNYFLHKPIKKSHKISQIGARSNWQEFEGRKAQYKRILTKQAS